MRISFEITDEQIRTMINEQVGAMTAKIAQEVIRTQIDRVIEAKFDRIRDSEINAAVLNAAAGTVARYFAGSSTSINAVIRQAAMDLLKEAAK